MRRTLAGLALIIAVAAAGVWAVASVAPPTSAPQREPALVVPVVGSPTPEVTAAPAGPTPSVTATPSPSSPVSTSATPSGAESTTGGEAPETVSAPKPSYYDDHGGDDDDDDRDDDSDDDD